MLGVIQPRKALRWNKNKNLRFDVAQSDWALVLCEPVLYM